jgi:hypothetical protein
MSKGEALSIAMKPCLRTLSILSFLVCGTITADATTAKYIVRDGELKIFNHTLRDL